MSFYSRTCAQSKFVTLFKKKSVFSAHDSAPQITGLTGLSLSLLALAGCQSMPAENASVDNSMPEPMTEQVAVAELNIPESVAEAACDCEALVVEVEETYFDRAIRALAARDYAQALQYFEAHRDADEANAVREAEIGLAFIAVLQADSRDPSNSQALDDRAEVISLALSLLTRLEDKVASLGKANSQLVDDLKKREAVLERLRELTLGQLED